MGPGADPGAQAPLGCTQREQKRLGKTGAKIKVVTTSFTWFSSRSDTAERLRWEIPCNLPDSLM